jgi:glutamine cyclotransferase
LYIKERSGMRSVSKRLAAGGGIALCLVMLFSCSESESTPASPGRNDTSNGGSYYYTYRVINIYPHDRDAYTQGLAFEDGFLFESTGLYGESSLRKVDLETGAILQRYDLPDAFFGEGMTIWNDSIIQITWRENKGIIYNKEDFDSIGEFTYPWYGWGLTHDGRNLILSDGTSTLHFLDPHSFDEVRHIDVFDSIGSVRNLNELEYIDGRIYANIYMTDLIALIDPVTGEITGLVDLTGLYDSAVFFQGIGVLNGIAYDSEGDRLFVTGKQWDKLFEIELVPIE